MKVISLLAVVGLAMTSLGNDETGDARKAIEARFGQISKAFANKDTKLFQSIITDDYKAKAPGKPVSNRAEVIREFEAQMKIMSGIKWFQKIKSFALEDGVAKVNFESEMTSKVTNGDGKTHDFRLISKTKNEWIKGNKGWRVRYSESLEFKLWIDGEELKSDLSFF